MSGSLRIAYIVSPDLIKYSSLLPSNSRRSLIVHNLVKDLGLLGKNEVKIITPRRAGKEDLSMFHDEEYLDFVLSPDEWGKGREEEFGLIDDCAVFEGLGEYVRLVGGAMLTAVSAIKSGKFRVAVVWDGGRHHAGKSKASGYCYVADCVLGLLSLKKAPSSGLHLASTTPATTSSTHPKRKVMYIDLDLHFGDGVAEAFYSTRKYGVSQVLTLSIHHSSASFYPPPSFLSMVPDPNSSLEFSPFSLSIPLREGASNSTFRRVWGIVEKVREVYDPDCVIVQCGVDGLAGDPCKTFNWGLCGTGTDSGSEGSLGWCVERVFGWGRQVILTGGGGYDTPNASRAWAYLTSLAIGSALPPDTPLEHHPMYGPSFVLDVQPGMRADLNDEAYLLNMERVYEDVIGKLDERMKSADPS